MLIGKVTGGIKISVGIIAFCLIVLGFAFLNLPPVSYVDKAATVAVTFFVILIAAVVLLVSIEESNRKALSRR